jgi:hypothetical protein
MHRSNHPLSRALALIVMAIGLFALGAGSVAAAPGSMGGAMREAAQTVDVCLGIDVDGDGILSDVELDAAALVDLDGDGAIADADDIAIYGQILLGSCDAAIADDDTDGVRNGEDNCVGVAMPATTTSTETASPTRMRLPSAPIRPIRTPMATA